MARSMLTKQRESAQSLYGGNEENNGRMLQMQKEILIDF